MEEPSPVESSLRLIAPKRWWGGGPLGVLNLRDKVFIGVCGVRVVVLDDSDASSTLYPEYDAPLSEVLAIALSSDKKFLAVSVHLKYAAEDSPRPTVHTSTLLIYDSDAYTKPKKRPVVIEYQNESFRSYASSHFECVSFSDDSQLLVCRAQGQILVYDWRINALKYSFGDAAVEDARSLFFFKGDSTKLVGIGANNFFKIWRYSQRKVHSVPMGGIADVCVRKDRSADCSFESHAWLTNDLLLVGCSNGQVCVVVMHSCEIIDRIPLFPHTERIIAVLCRSDIGVFLTRSGRLCIADVILPVGRSTSVKLSILTYVNLPSEASYNCMQWCYQSSMLAFDIITVSCASLCMYDLKMSELRHKAIDAFIADAGVNIASESSIGELHFDSASLQSTSSIGTIGTIGTLGTTGVACQVTSSVEVLHPKHTLGSYHSNGVSQICTASRMSSVASYSTEEHCIRVWNYLAPSHPCTAKLSRSSLLVNDVPCHIDLHPSGRFVAFACVNDAQEYAVTDTSLTFVKRIPTRVAVLAPNGEAYANYSPCSLVKYSHGGSLLGVATAKTIQVFDMYILEYTSDSKGTPTRCGVFAMHTSHVVTMVFCTDDRRILSSSEDGAIYEWEIRTGVRLSEFTMRQSVCNVLSVSPTSGVVAYFEQHAHAKKRRRNKEEGELSKTSNSEQPQKTSRQICVWSDSISLTPDTVIDVGACGVTSLALANVKLTVSENRFDSVLIVGYDDGSVLISSFPVPLVSTEVSGCAFNSSETTESIGASIDLTAADDGADGKAVLCSSQGSIDKTRCRVLHLHRGAVASLAASQCGNWIFTGGIDGAILMLATNSKSALSVFNSESSPMENSLTMTDVVGLKLLQSNAANRVSQVAELTVESKKQLEELRNERDEVIRTLEERLHRDVGKRDQIIITERDGHIRSVAQLHKEEREGRARRDRDLMEVEHKYEVTLAQESLYLFQMKQAYEEVAEHKRLDAEAHQRSVARKESLLNEEIRVLREKNSRQKALVEQYTAFIRQESDEVISGIEEEHEDRAARLELEVEVQTRAVTEADARGRSEAMVLRRTIAVLKEEAFASQKHVDVLESELLWAKDRNNRLEEALQSATLEIKERAEANARLEYTAGGQQQAVLELERARKTLTSQLFDLRQDTGPKEQLLATTLARLREIECEYEHAMHAMAEKDSVISQRSSGMHMLQQQLKDLRGGAAKRTQVLRRAAAQLSEYKSLLDRALVNSVKVSANASVEVGQQGKAKLCDTIVCSDEMSVCLRRLDEVLAPFANTDLALEHEKEYIIDEQDVQNESDRHMAVLSRTVHSLQGSIDSKGRVASRQFLGSIRENSELITEVNELRKEIRAIALDKQRLVARNVFAANKHRVEVRPPHRKRSPSPPVALPTYPNREITPPIIAQISQVGFKPDDSIGLAPSTAPSSVKPIGAIVSSLRTDVSHADSLIDDLIKRNAEAIYKARSQEIRSEPVYISTRTKMQLTDRRPSRSTSKKLLPSKNVLLPIQAGRAGEPKTERYDHSQRNSRALDIEPDIHTIVYKEK